MELFIKNFACLCFLPFYVCSPADIDTLQLVSIVYRHGDRTPYQPYKASQYNVSNYWTQGLGQLTKKGIEGEYELGKYLRNRYDGYLPKAYNVKDIYVRSTDMDRALMSAYSVLAALYKDDSDDVPYPWQPVPVHTVPSDTDFILEVPGRCAATDALVQERKNSTLVQNIFKTYKSLFEELGRKTGENITVDTFGFVTDTLHIEHIYNISPSWLRPEQLDILLTQVKPLMWYNNFCGADMCKLAAGGRLVRKFLTDMDLAINPQNPEMRLKVYMYSAHDSTVVSTLCTMNLYNNMSVPYGSTVMVELHKSKTTYQYFVRVFYKNITYNSDAEHQLQLPGCELDCPLDKFKQLVANYTPDTMAGKCPSHSDFIFNFFTGQYDATTILLIVLITEVGCLLVVLSCSVCTLQRCRNHKIKHRTYGRIRLETHPEEVPMISPAGGSDGEE